MNLAIMHSLTFGKDFVFTYGPLGYLSTRAALGISGDYLFLFDLFLISNVALILRHYWTSNYNAAIVLICLIFCYLFPAEAVPFKLLVIMVFWLQLAITKNSFHYFALSSVIAVLSFFIKLNTSFLAIFIFYTYLLGSIFSNGIKTWKIALALFVPLMLYGLAILLNVDLPGYVMNGLELSIGYNDAMGISYWPPSRYSFEVTLLTIFCSGYFVYVFLKTNKDNKIKTIASIICWELLTLALFKQSLTRESPINVINFLYFAPIVWLLSLSVVDLKSRAIKIMVTATAVFTLIASIGPLRYVVEPTFFDPLNRMSYLHDLVTTKDQLEIEDAARKRFALPTDVKNMIGNETIDIVPWNIDLIYFNRLNYDPRPVIQSYAAYTDRLAQLNRAKYDKPDRPHFIILQANTIDGRYGFFDDEWAKIAILKNYFVKHSFKLYDIDYLLLETSHSPLDLELSDPRTETLKLGDTFVLPNEGQYFARITIDYSTLGSILRLIYRPSLKMVLYLDDGTEREFRPVLSILKSGVILNPYVETTKDYEPLITDNGRGLKRIKGIRFVPENDPFLRWLADLAYSNSIAIEIREMSLSK